MRQERYQDYVAVVQSGIGHMLCSYFGGEWQMPGYIEYMYPDRVKKEEPTYQDVISGLLKRLNV